MVRSGGSKRVVEERAPSASLEGELIALIAANAQRTWLPVTVGGLLVALMLARYVPVDAAFGWFASLVLALLFRTRLLRKLDREGSALSGPQKINRVILAFQSTAMVQAAVMFFFPLVPVPIGAIMTCYLVSLCAGMIGSTAGCHRVVLWYTVTVMGAVILAWGLTPDPNRDGWLRGGFGLLTLAYIKAISDYASRAYRVFCESYQIRQQQLELNRQLNEALVEARQSREQQMELNRQLNEALAKAESASRAKTRFLASASHDLRQPLHALSLFSGSLQMRSLDARSSDIARQIDKSVRVLSSQLDTLLDISLLDAGLMKVVPASIELLALLLQLEEEYSAQVSQKGLSLLIDCPARLFVRSDPALLHRIFGNLLSNAIKYTDAGRVEIRARGVAQGCEVSVSDTGRGIPEAEFELVFEEFYQLANPERDRGKGLGLGLSIVRRLCELLNVPLSLESKVGEGTRFTAVLSRVDDLVIAPLSAERLSAGVPRVRVLVIDDEESVRLGMSTLLEEMGFRVLAVASTDAALASLQEFEPEVVLADFRLRGDDTGLKAIAALREVLPRLPALLISGDTAPDRLREAHDAGVELLHKPLQAAVLRESILNAVPT